MVLEGEEGSVPGPCVSQATYPVCTKELCESVSPALSPGSSMVRSLISDGSDFLWGS